ncbi:MAG: TonB-dependent receptor [Cellvibrionaceae bacterium]|nr:TonB-dependent receptor [Cellvibrionaceae bacterium]
MSGSIHKVTTVFIHDHQEFSMSFSDANAYLSVNNNQFALKPLAIALHLICTGALLNIPLTAQAQDAASTASTPSAITTTSPKRYDIPTGSLTTALTQFISMSGVYLSGAAELAQGKTTQGLRGHYSTEDGLEKLLEGTGLQAVKSDGGYLLQPLPQAAMGTLKAVKVTANADLSSSYATEVASIARGADSLKEVPQSVTVVTDKLIEDQNLTMMSDAMAKAPGIVATTDGLGNPEFRSRGFLIDNYQIDNLGTSYTSTFRPDFDLAIYDRVEILRGADGLFSAAGEPGGTVNLARKRPTDELRSSVSLAYGSWSNSRIEADIGGPIALEGRLRGRLVGVWQDREFFYSPADEEKQVIYGILEYDLTSSTKISGGASHQHVDGITWMGGFPTYTDSRQLGCHATWR